MNNVILSTKKSDDIDGKYVSIVDDIEHLVESIFATASVLALCAFGVALVSGAWA